MKRIQATDARFVVTSTGGVKTEMPLGAPFVLLVFDKGGPKTRAARRTLVDLKAIEELAADLEEKR